MSTFLLNISVTFRHDTIVQSSRWVKKQSKQILWHGFLSECNSLTLYGIVCALRGQALPLSGTFEVYKRRSEESIRPRRVMRSCYRISHVWHICFISSQDMSLCHDVNMTCQFTVTVLSKQTEQTSFPSGNPTTDWTVSRQRNILPAVPMAHQHATQHGIAERKTNKISTDYQSCHIWYSSVRIS